MFTCKNDKIRCTNVLKDISFNDSMSNLVWSSFWSQWWSIQYVLLKCLAFSRVYSIYYKQTLFSLMEIWRLHMYDFKDKFCSFWLRIFSLCFYCLLISNWVSTRTKQGGGGDLGCNNWFLIGNFAWISPERDFEVAMYSELIIV